MMKKIIDFLEVAIPFIVTTTLVVTIGGSAFALCFF